MKNFFAIFALIAAVILSGCGGADSASGENFAVIEDDIGRSVEIKSKPERIAVTSASFLEPLHKLGANIVGRPDSKNNMPDWAKDIPSLGAVYQIDVERLIACQPDLVIINKGMNEKLLPVLEENKIPALVVEMKTYDDVKRGLKNFSLILPGSTAFRICTPAAFIHMKHRRRCGRTGRSSSSSTDIWMHRSRCMRIYFSW